MNQRQHEVHDTIAQVAYDRVLMDDPKFAPLYYQRKKWMLEQGYNKEEAEQEAHRFVCAEILLYLWCEYHSKLWIPWEPENPHAHTDNRIYADKGMA